MSAFDEMNAAVREAETTLARVNHQASRMIHMVVGNLRQGNYRDLVRLKKELANFNMKTGEWKD